MAHHHVSQGIYSRDRRAAIRTGLLNRKTKGLKTSGPRWGYLNDLTDDLTGDAKALLRVRGKRDLSYRKLASMFGCSKSTAHRLCRKFSDLVDLAASEEKANPN